jgi:hypothetical protein
MKKRLRVSLYSLLVITLCGISAQADPILTFTPDPSSGEVSGIAGSTVGWGFDITNTSDVDTLLINGTDFCPGGELHSPCPAPGQPDLGTYSDALSGNSDYNTLNPSQEETLGPDGLGTFVINPDLTPGIYTGVLVIYYEVYDADFNDLGSEDVTAVASIDVTSSESPSVPEPGSLILLATGLGALFSRRTRTKGRA